MADEVPGKRFKEKYLGPYEVAAKIRVGVFCPNYLFSL